jgi:hypothetical protein
MSAPQPDKFATSQGTSLRGSATAQTARFHRCRAPVASYTVIGTRNPQLSLRKTEPARGWHSLEPL